MSIPIYKDIRLLFLTVLYILPFYIILKQKDAIDSVADDLSYI